MRKNRTKSVNHSLGLAGRQYFQGEAAVCFEVLDALSDT
jgi:hypothetical protein